MKKILAIDPGNVFSGYTIMADDFTPIEKGKVENNQMMEILKVFLKKHKQVTIEMVGCYMMNAGRSVFDTCIFIGRLQQECLNHSVEPFFIERRYIKLNLCGKVTANDTIVIDALVNRFSSDNMRNHGKGTKKNQGYFYGFAKDMWQAYAVGVTYLDIQQKRFAY